MGCSVSHVSLGSSPPKMILDLGAHTFAPFDSDLKPIRRGSATTSIIDRCKYIPRKLRSLPAQSKQANDEPTLDTSSETKVSYPTQRFIMKWRAPATG